MKMRKNEKLVGVFEIEENVVFVTDNNDFSFPDEPPTPEQIEEARRDGLRIAADLRAEEKALIVNERLELKKRFDNQRNGEKPWHGFKDQMLHINNQIDHIKRIPDLAERKIKLLTEKSKNATVFLVFQEHDDLKEAIRAIETRIDAEIAICDLKDKTPAEGTRETAGKYYTIKEIWDAVTGRKDEKYQGAFRTALYREYKIAKGKLLLTDPQHDIPKMRKKLIRFK